MPGSKLMWYGPCGLWTTDWDSLSVAHGSESSIKSYLAPQGIPCCPDCGCVGFQSDRRGWFDGMKQMSKRRPKYEEFNMTLRDRCCGRGFHFERAYAEFLAGYYDAKHECLGLDEDEYRFLGLVKEIMFSQNPLEWKSMDKDLEKLIAVKLLADSSNKSPE